LNSGLGDWAVALAVALAFAVAVEVEVVDVVVVDDDVVVKDVVNFVVHGLWTWDLGPWSIDFGH
jgi:hypothetical protein